MRSGLHLCFRCSSHSLALLQLICSYDGQKPQGRCSQDDPDDGRWTATLQVDGCGSSIVMDDAGIPSLLSLPLVGIQPLIDANVYSRTRKMLLSEDNPLLLEVLLPRQRDPHPSPPPFLLRPFAVASSLIGCRFTRRVIPLSFKSCLRHSSVVRIPL